MGDKVAVAGTLHHTPGGVVLTPPRCAWWAWSWECEVDYVPSAARLRRFLPVSSSRRRSRRRRPSQVPKTQTAIQSEAQSVWRIKIGRRVRMEPADRLHARSNILLDDRCQSTETPGSATEPKRHRRAGQQDPAAESIARREPAQNKAATKQRKRRRKQRFLSCNLSGHC